MTCLTTRRQAMAIGAGAFAAALLGGSIDQASAANNADELIKKFTGGKSPTTDRVKLDLPEIAENGSTVPMTVMVESPMSEQSYVEAVLVVADDNPNGRRRQLPFLASKRSCGSQHPYPPRYLAERDRHRQDE